MTSSDRLTPDEAEAQFNPQRSVPNSAEYGARRAPVNERALAHPGRVADLAWAPQGLNSLDLYPPAGSGPWPVHAFIHGGYWRAQDKRNFAFTATELNKRGILVAVLNYDLCPAVTLDGTVASALGGLEWLLRHAPAHGGDLSRFTLSGHSAGAHLVAAALATDWAARGLPANPFSGALLTSGIYNPAPAMLTTVNADLHLTPEIAARHDYEALAPRCTCPCWVMVGGEEPVLWIDHSLRYAQHLRRHGLKPGVLVAPGFHHFDILDQYLDPASDIQRLLRLLAP